LFNLVSELLRSKVSGKLLKQAIKTLYSSYEKNTIMSTKHKRFLGISILFIAAGIYKIYTKGIYQNDEILWFNILMPFGIGLLFLVYTLFTIFSEKKST
jgi:hypothetical protein